MRMSGIDFYSSYISRIRRGQDQVPQMRRHTCAPGGRRLLRRNGEEKLKAAGRVVRFFCHSVSRQYHAPLVINNIVTVDDGRLSSEPSPIPFEACQPSPSPPLLLGRLCIRFDGF